MCHSSETVFALIDHHRSHEAVECGVEVGPASSARLIGGVARDDAGQRTETSSVPETSISPPTWRVR
jgi:hypothetical protein